MELEHSRKGTAALVMTMIACLWTALALFTPIIQPAHLPRQIGWDWMQPKPIKFLFWGVGPLLGPIALGFCIAVLLDANCKQTFAKLGVVLNLPICLFSLIILFILLEQFCSH